MWTMYLVMYRVHGDTYMYVTTRGFKYENDDVM